MRPPIIPIGQLELLPLCHRETIPESYLDLLGHMNVQFYFLIFNKAAMHMMSSLGLDEAYIRDERGGNFVLRQVINYLNEIHVGDTVAVRGRILGRSEKRMHKMYFLINETKNLVAATSEVLTSHANLETRRTSPFPAEMAGTIDARIAEFDRLGWDAPVSGIIQP